MALGRSQVNELSAVLLHMNLGAGGEEELDDLGMARFYRQIKSWVSIHLVSCVHFGAGGEENLHDLDMASACRDLDGHSVKHRSSIDIRARGEQLLHGGQIAEFHRLVERHGGGGRCRLVASCQGGDQAGKRQEGRLRHQWLPGN